MLSTAELKLKYDSCSFLYSDFCKEFVKQITFLHEEKKIKLATSITHRVKTWESVLSKIKRYNLELTDINEINDIAGIRIILLFSREVISMREIIESNFIVLRMEDTSDRLQENQFGYGSVHYELKFPDEWLITPTLKRFSELTVEVQVRTNAQHIWASTSHLLQYKSESSTPIPLRRSINRTAALLEMVDLEFERLLKEREEYVSTISEQEDDYILDIEILKDISKDLLPENNYDEEDDYEVLIELTELGILKKSDLLSLIQENLEYALNIEMVMLDRERKLIEKGEQTNQFVIARINTNTYFSHTGIIRTMLRNKFGSEIVNEIIKKKTVE